MSDFVFRYTHPMTVEHQFNIARFFSMKARGWPIESGTRTTPRAAMQLVHSGIFERHPQLEVILSHAGGFVRLHRIALPNCFSD